MQPDIENAKIVLVDPYLSIRNQFVANILKDTNARLWWIDCTQEIETLEDFIGAWLGEAEVDAPTDWAPDQSVGELARSLADVLSSSLSVEPTLLVIEAWDAITDPAIREFLVAFVALQSSSLQVILIGRAFHLWRWENHLRAGRAYFYSNLSRKTFTEMRNRSMIRGLAFSKGVVYARGTQVEDWGRKYADEIQRLFWYILEHPTFNLMDVSADLYPDEPVGTAQRHVRSLLKRLNVILNVGNQSTSSLLRIIGRAVYAPDADVLRCYDVHLFEEAWEQARKCPEEERRKWLLEMVRLHRSPYLYTTSEPRVARRRQALLRRHAETLEILVRERLNSDDPQELHEALGLALRAIRSNPVREDLYRHGMMLYERMGMPGDALALYEVLVRRVRAISPLTQSLHEEIQSRFNR